MDIGRGFITTLVDEGRLNEATRSGITTDFLDEEFSSIYNYVQRHFTQYRTVPSRAAILQAFPGFEFGKYSEPNDYFIDSLKESYKREILNEVLPKVAEVSESNTTKAEDLIRDALGQLQVTQKTFKDINIAESALDRVAAYKKRKENPGADGILSNWVSMDYQTLGWHAEEFIVLCGEKYMGKSWIMLWLAYQALLQNERVLVCTKEMSQDALTRRFDALYAGIKFERLRRGELTFQEEERYETAMEALAKSSEHLIIARHGVNTVQDMEHKAVEVDATCIFADSVYLFPADNKSNFNGETAKRVAISQKCKEIATNLGIPFIASVQGGRKKSKSDTPTLDDIEWSNSFSQDADTVFFLTKDDLDKELKRAQLWLLKSRDGDIAQFYIEQDFEYMKFTERDDEAAPTTSIDFDEEDDNEGGLFNEGDS